MNIEKSQVEEIQITGVDDLDLVSVVAETFEYEDGSNQGKITITCYGKAWTAFFGGIGNKSIAEFVCSCDEHYLANKLSTIDAEVYDLDAMRTLAERKGIECYRDDPWNDYEIMNELFGDDMSEWHYDIPKINNHRYTYLCRIIKTVQLAFLELEQS